MKYKITVEGISCEGEKYKNVGTAEITESAAFKYGNGKCLIIKLGGQCRATYDIRYDRTYNQDNEKDYIEKFLENQYCNVNYVNVENFEM